MPSVVDLFCGIGGLTHGFVRHGGFRVIGGVDADSSCKYTYEANNPGARFIDKKIEDLAPGDIAALYPDDAIRILVGCAPCQPFSTYSQPKKEDKERDRWNLLPKFGEIIAAVRPTVVSMENVPQLCKHDAFKQFVRALFEDGYKVSYGRVKCEYYGIPQSRERLVLLASKLGEISLPDPTHDHTNFVTVNDCIQGLPELAAGQVDPHDTVHRAPALSPLNMRRMLASRPGGTWKEWDAELLAPCHTKESGRSFTGVYARMRGDTIGPTITTECTGFGSGRFGHPVQHRAISPREAALLQTFPVDYRFVDPEKQEYVPTKYLARHIGNAVPVRLAECIADAIWRHLGEYGLVEMQDR